MVKRRKGKSKSKSVTEQVVEHSKKEVVKYKPYQGNFSKMISTGSTLLDLAISGTKVAGGGLPGGILVEIFGPSGLGKTVLLAEIAGDIQRKGGDVLFHDPEARLDTEFASIFGFKLDQDKYMMPNTVPELFKAAREWEFNPEKVDAVNGVMADSLAALSTEMEMKNDEGDKMGGRRAKEFSEQTRKTCRIIKQTNTLMVCSNQQRQNMNTLGFGEKYTTPGGEAVGYYASLRLRVKKPSKEARIKKKVTEGGTVVERTVGINTMVEVYKSSVDKPFRIAPITIIFDYGIDDIRQNLKFIKAHTRNTSYMVGTTKLGTSIDKAISTVEEKNLEKKLQKEVIALWERIESRFESKRKKKKR